MHQRYGVGRTRLKYVPAQTLDRIRKDAPPLLNI